MYPSQMHASCKQRQPLLRLGLIRLKSTQISKARTSLCVKQGLIENADNAGGKSRKKGKRRMAEAVGGSNQHPARMCSDSRLQTGSADHYDSVGQLPVLRFRQGQR